MGIAKERHRLEDQFRTASQELACALLPTLTLEEIERARIYTGLDFLQPSLLNGLSIKQEQLQNERRELEQQPNFDTDPKVLQSVTEDERQRLQDHQAALLPLLRTCLGHPRFSHLLRAGYGTSKYGFPFWRMSYYRDRKAAEELCQRTSHTSFSALLHDYHSANQAYESLSLKLEGLNSHTPSARQLWRDLGRQIEQLEQSHLSTVRTRITLALLKGGSIWKSLAAAELPLQCHELYSFARSIRQQLETQQEAF